MAVTQLNPTHVLPQGDYSRVASILESIDASKLIRRLNQYRLNGGPRTYSPISFWRAYMLTFLLDLSSVNALLRRLKNEPKLRELCGFSELPHRTTFNRFITRLSQHGDLVREAQSSVVNQLKVLIPDLGEKVAIDSTTVQTHSNPDKPNKLTGQVSDPEASWTAKTNKKKPKELDWYFGYKYHLVSDAVYQIPLTGFTTTARQADTLELSRLLDRAKSQYSWFKPKAVMADRGYDSAANHKFVLDGDGALICPMRRQPKSSNQLYGIFNRDGVPTCMGLELMDYIGTHPDKGHLYRCPVGGCQLKSRKGVVYCEDFTWVDWRTEPNKRLHGPVRRGSSEWEALYSLRYSVERIFKSMKESLRLERHYIRGLTRISLHASMSALTYSATVLTQIRAQSQTPLWMVERVA